MVGMCTRPAIERAGNGNPPPTAGRARFLSQSVRNPLLRNRVRPGRPERRSHLLNAETLQAAIESRVIATVTIVNQELRWQSIPSAALHYLLGYPLCCRKRRYRNVQNFPGSSAGLQKRHGA